MKTLLISMALLTGYLAHAEAEDGWELKIKDDGAAYISFKRDLDDPQAPSLKGLLALIDTLEAKSVGPLQHISFSSFFVGNSDIQKELRTQFAEKHADLLKAAQASAGNMHNPKVLPLRAVFAEALLKTPTVKKIDQLLDAHGYRVSGVSHEKFSLDKSAKSVTFRSFVWLTIKQSAEQKKNAQAPAAGESKQ